MSRPFPSWLVVMCSLSCAGGGAAPAPADHVVVVDDQGAMRRISDETMTAHFPAQRERVWPALMAAYADLGIQPTEADETNGVFANKGFVFPPRLLDRPTTYYFDCGGGLSTFSSSGRLLVSVESHLTPARQGETIVVTQVVGHLRSNAGTSTNVLDCASRGRLEEYLRKSILLKLTQTR